MQNPTSLFARMKDDVKNTVNGMVERRHVTGFDDNGRVRTSDLDPDISGEEVLALLRPDVKVGDDVVTMKAFGRSVVLGAIRKPTDVVPNFVTDLGGDGSSPAAARADHHHNAANGNADSTIIGRGSSGTHRATTLGVSSTSADAGTAIGAYSAANGYIGIAIGWAAKALAQLSVAVGYDITIDTTSDQAIAIGDRSSVAASSPGAIAIGAHSRASGARSWVVGHAAQWFWEDQGLLKANRVYIDRSSGPGDTSIALRTPTGVWKPLVLQDNDTLVVGSRTIGNPDPNLTYPTNRSIAAGGPYNFRSAPVVDPSNLIIAVSSASIYDPGWAARSSGGFSWKHVFMAHVGWGWITADALV